MAHHVFGVNLPLQVLESAAGFYLGTVDESGPVSRESEEYWTSKDEAETALERGEFLQRWEP